MSAVFYGFYVWHYKSVPQAVIPLMNNINDPKPSDKILVFSPHPDDETIAAGGFLKTATSVGAKVWIVLVTDGNKYRMEKARYAEFSDVTAELGVPNTSLYFLNYPDGKLAREDQNIVISKFETILAETNPTIILVPHPEDRHPDHRTTGEDAQMAISYLKSSARVYYYLVHYPRFPNPDGLRKNLFVTPPINLLSLSIEWLNFSLDSELEKIKNDALLKYKSQLIFPPLKELIEAFIRKNEIFAVSK